MPTAQILLFFVLPAVAYVIGSIPFAFIIGKSKGVDIRTVGSKNVGATNLGRALGMPYFFLAFLLDAAKGFAPVLVEALLIRRLDPTYQVVPNWAPLLTGGAAMVGHLFPIFLKFKGGKGVSTGFGAVLGFWPLFTLAALVGITFFAFMLMIYRYISFASMTSSVIFVATVAGLACWEHPPRWMPIVTYLTWPQRWPMVLVAGVFSFLIIIRHRGNIVRLMKGTEPKILQGRKAKAAGPAGEPPQDAAKT